MRASMLAKAKFMRPSLTVAFQFAEFVQKSQLGVTVSVFPGPRSQNAQSLNPLLYSPAMLTPNAD